MKKFCFNYARTNKDIWKTKDLDDKVLSEHS